MAIPVIQFAPLTAEQANPLMSGVNTGLSTYQNFINAKYANPMAQALLAYRQAQVPLVQAQTSEINQGKIPLEQAQAMAQRALPGLYAAQAADAYSDVPLHQAQAGYYNVQSQLDPYRVAGSLGALPGFVAGAQLVNNYMPQAAASLGLNFGIPQGAPSVTNNVPTPHGAANVQAPIPSATPQQNIQSPVIGGYPTYAQAPAYPMGATMQAQGAVSAPASPAAMIGTPAAAPQNLWQMQLHNMVTGMSKNPAFGSNKSGAGGTYFNPQTGEYYTTDTGKNTSIDQNTVAAIQRVQPLLQQITQSLPQFQGAAGKAKLFGSQVLNSMFPALNLNAPEAYATGQTNINLAAESLVKAMGLNATDETLAMMKEAIAPRFGETQPQYTNRLLTTLSDLYRNQQQATQRLKGGMPLGSPQIQSAANLNADPLGLR